MASKPALDEMVEKTRSSREVFRGRILAVHVDEVELPSGFVSTREVVRHGGAVAVVPVTAAGSVVMVYQYRYAAGEVTLEIPAGKLDPGEEPHECARRELGEETGLKAGRLTRLFSLLTTPGFSDEVIHVFTAEDLVDGEPNPDADENLRRVELTRDGVFRAIREGEIRDAKTIAGVLAYFHLQRPDHDPGL